ncbi:NAD-dependent epimerase/dehydratase family protein [Uliginosibacterium sp. 31-16]|uniref:NAD-dependent epimerase/dehydratase family protein n=1 Tax=Uliginosibacterium sp. 31-16 TaxID=3068315 RepID=UPI00273D8817|nr:NAD-dependent epimerase/dehydratase family protein [Uliginosibacterium sp. 31-16]MDP5238441.1 NAD-dependent epimerase/dehydratase family protein [Uliginosibacterium sp. 31-16]
MPPAEIGLLGASSPVGACVVARLRSAGRSVHAFSRQSARPELPGVCWSQPGAAGPSLAGWISLLPLWVLPEYFPWLEQRGVRRIVVLSSTSRFAKLDSADPAEQRVARRLIAAEQSLQDWADARGVEWVILRPTLIYGSGRDHNVAEIARFHRRHGFFPVFGAACGLRQPVHVEDVAQACCAGLDVPGAAGQAYSLSGAEALSYQDMVRRTVAAAGLRPRVLRLPLWAFRLGLRGLRVLPRCRDWSLGMAERMNHDQTFEHAEAVRDLGFAPRSFMP